MTDERDTDESVRRMEEHYCSAPGARYVGHYNLMPIFEVDEIPPDGWTAEQ